jgi:methyl-accepting chemotaxis protein
MLYFIKKQGIGEISVAMTKIDEVTQSNAATSEELSATTESLSHQVQDLVDTMSYFKVEGIHDQTKPAQENEQSKQSKTVLAANI